MYVYACMDIDIYIYIYSCVLVDIHICIAPDARPTNVHVCIYIHYVLYNITNVCVCMYVCMDICIYSYVFAYIHICIARIAPDARPTNVHVCIYIHYVFV